VRDLAINSLRQRSITVEAGQIEDIRAGGTALGLLANAVNGDGRARTTSLPSGSPQVDGLSQKHAPKSMPVFPDDESPRSDDLDAGWQELTLLQAGEIAPRDE